MENTIMKKLIIFTGILLAIAATGCKKSGLGDDPVAGTDTREDISFGSVVINKAFSGESATTFTNGFSFTVNDLLKSGASESAHIDKDAITYGASTKTWTYDSKKTYQWKEGTHTFFGWSKNDGFIDANTFWGSAPVLNGRALTLPTKVLTTADANQFDFLYSDLFQTTAAQWKSSHDKDATVQLAFNHLFSAVSMTLENLVADKSVTVKSVKLTNTFKNRGAATITFGDPAATDQTATKVVVLPTAATSTTPYIAATAITEGTLATGAKIDILDQKALAADGTPKFGLVWPQTFDGNGKELEVVYKREGDAGYTTSKLSIPATTWEPGYKYKYNLQITPNDAQLIFEVMPWTVVDVPVNTENGSINMSNVTWQNTVVTLNQGTATESTANTLDNGAYSVYMYHNASVQVIKRDANGEPVHQTYLEDVYGEDGKTIIHSKGEYVVDEYGNATVYEMEWKTYDYYPAQGYFTVNYPKSGLFKIELIPAYGQTKEDLNASMYEIYIYEYPTKKEVDGQEVTVPGYFRPINPEGETISMKTVYFQVCASENVADTHPQYKAQIDIWFKATDSNEWVSGYSEIRATYACIIPAVN